MIRYILNMTALWSFSIMFCIERTNIFMKKFRLLLVAVFMLCLTLTACQGKDSLNGYWVMTGMEAMGQKVELDKAYPDGKIGFLSFESGSKFIVYFGSDTEVVKGTWEKTTLDIQGVAKYEFTKSNEKPKQYDEVVKK